MGWIRYSPSDFVFSAKLPKLITHDKKLGLKAEVKRDLEVFLDLMQPLQLSGKLACLLIQLPPKYDFNPENLEAFFKLLDPRFRYAVEFRNISWMRGETWDILKEYNVSYTNVDEPLLPGDVQLTSDLAYFRWHGRGKSIWFDYNYSKEELESWIPKIKETLTENKENCWLLQQSLSRVRTRKLSILTGKTRIIFRKSKTRKKCVCKAVPFRRFSRGIVLAAIFRAFS